MQGIDPNSVGEGAVIAVPSGKTIFDGMTELEAQMAAGQVDLAKFGRVVDMPNEVGTIDATKLEDRINKISNTPQQIAPVVGGDELPANVFNEKLAALNNLASAVSPIGDIVAASVTKPIKEAAAGERAGKEPMPPVTAEPKWEGDPNNSLLKELPVEREEAETLKNCPNCSWDLGTDPLTVSDQDKYAWLQAVLGNKTFEKTYSLFGGKYFITFRTRSLKVVEMINGQLLRENADGRIPATPSRVYLLAHNQRLRQLNLAASLVHYSGLATRLPDMNSAESKLLYGDSAELPAAAFKSLFENFSSDLYGVVYKQMLIFDDMVYKLTETASSPDFWETTSAPN